MSRTNQPSDVRQPLLSYAARILGSRPYFSGRLRQKLLERADKLGLKDAESAIDGIISDLQTNRFLDDQYLAEGYVRKELRKGWGPSVITLKLTRLGVDPETAKKAVLAQADLESQRQAITHYLKKLSRLDPRIQKNRLFRRGFNSSAILGTFDSMGEED